MVCALGFTKPMKSKGFGDFGLESRLRVDLCMEF